MRGSISPERGRQLRLHGRLREMNLPFLAECLFEEFLGRNYEGMAWRSGGYLALYDAMYSHGNGVAPRLILLMQVGEVEVPEKYARYAALAIEKAVRLASNHKHLTSFESRCEAEDKWPGAVRLKTRDYDLILSFSGATAIVDEAFAVELFGRMPGFGGGNLAQQIKAITGNTLLAA